MEGQGKRERERERGKKGGRHEASNTVQGTLMYVLYPTSGFLCAAFKLPGVSSDRVAPVLISSLIS